MLEPPLVVAEPVCLATPEELLDEPLSVLEAVFVFEAVFLLLASPVPVAEGFCVCDAVSEST